MEERTSKYWLRIQREPIDLRLADDYLRVEEAGAVDLFLGTTRRWTAGRETRTLQYEAYRGMALSEMKRLVELASSRWPLLRVCLWHREGEVPLRETSVLVGVATAHRDAAFAACRYLIDELKNHVPIWKQEFYADGSSEWVEGDSSRVSEGPFESEKQRDHLA